MSTPSPQFDRVPEDIDVSLLQHSLVVVIGIGMVGSQIAEGLARFTVGHLRLIDHDIYEMENTLRHALPVEYVGSKKATGLADWLPQQYLGLRAKAIAHKVDGSVSDDELDDWIAGADLVVAATDDREAQRRIGRRALINEVAAIFPALYPHVGGGEVILQLDSEWPCFGCWDYFRPNTEQLRGARALDLDAQPVIYQAEQFCLGVLDPGSRQNDLLRGEHSGDPPHQLVMLDRAGVPSFGSLPRRDDCPSCGGEQRSPLVPTTSNRQRLTQTASGAQASTIQSASSLPTIGEAIKALSICLAVLAFIAAPWVIMSFVLPTQNSHPTILTGLVSIVCALWALASIATVVFAIGVIADDLRR